jgi:F0F1-type ATP synthase membrane subunit a
MRSGKRKDRMKLSLSAKLVEKLVWVQVISLCKIFILSYAFDALLCRNRQSFVKIVYDFVPNLVNEQISGASSMKQRFFSFNFCHFYSLLFCNLIGMISYSIPSRPKAGGT